MCNFRLVAYTFVYEEYLVEHMATYARNNCKAISKMHTKITHLIIRAQKWSEEIVVIILTYVVLNLFNKNDINTLSSEVLKWSIIIESHGFWDIIFPENVA